MILYELVLNPATSSELLSQGVTMNYLNMFEIMKTNPNNKLSNVTLAYKNSLPFIKSAIPNPSLFECIEFGTNTKISDPNVNEWIKEFNKIAKSCLDISKIRFTTVDNADNIAYNTQYTYPIKKAVASWNRLFKLCQDKEILFQEFDLYELFNKGAIEQTGNELPQNEFLSRELFINVFIDFANEIIQNVSKEHKKRTSMKTNDFLDLMIMLYVKEGDKLWTLEVEWIERISKLFPNGKYLFSGDKYLKSKQSLTEEN